MKKADYSKSFIGLSLACIVLAVIGTAGTDIFLASTQWILMAILFGVYSIWTRC